MEKKNYDLTQITRMLLEMRDNCVPKDSEAYDDPKRMEKYDALKAAIDLINNPSLLVTSDTSNDKIVRCKDCHFWTPNGVFGKYILGGTFEYGRCPYFSETRECFYCAYGQKRTSKEEETK